MNEAVRHAEPADLGVLVALEFDARRTVAHERGGPERLAELPERAAPGWAAAVADPDHVVGLATLDGIVLGYVSAVVSGGVVRVDTIWVEPDARELGLGEELLTFAIETGRTRGAQAVEAVVLPGDRSTKNLYERFGIKARSLTVYRRLDDLSD